MNKRFLAENKSIQHQFINRLANSLRNFKWKGNGEANFSCPVCGDSETNKLKARGYLLVKENLYRYYCHNCNFSAKFSFFLKTINSSLFHEYQRELIKGNSVEEPMKTKALKPKPIPSEQISSTKIIDALSIDQLSNSHEAKEYILRRQIPEKYHKKLFYIENFGNWVRQYYDPNYAGGNDERIIIPFYNGRKKLVAFQGRALSGNTRLRYITIKLNEKAPKIFNYDQVDTSRKIYIVEGPIDAMFLPNAIAIAGSDVSKTLDKLNFDFVFVADREPRNPEIIKKIANMIDRKYKVALLPDSMPGKDINEYILNGYTASQIVSMIDRFTFEGLQATFQLKMWQKI